MLQSFRMTFPVGLKCWPSWQRKQPCRTQTNGGRPFDFLLSELAQKLLSMLSCERSFYIELLPVGESTHVETVSVQPAPAESSTPFHALSIERAFTRLESTPEGLASEEAKRRLEKYGANELQAAQRHWAVMICPPHCATRSTRAESQNGHLTSGAFRGPSRPR